MPKKKPAQSTGKAPPKEQKSKPDGYVFGRPTKFTPELAKRICHLVSTHTYGIRRLCAMHEWMPEPSTINAWRWEKQDFSVQYTKAKLQQAELLAEETLDIADDTSQDIKLNALGDEVCNTEFVNRSRLRVDTRKWLTSKLLPKIYGELAKGELLQEENTELKKELEELREQLDAKHKKDY